MRLVDDKARCAQLAASKWSYQCAVTCLFELDKAIFLVKLDLVRRNGIGGIQLLMRGLQVVRTHHAGLNSWMI